MTTLRILKLLCLEPESVIESVPKNEGPKEIKFMYALIELYSLDVMPMFQNIIQVCLNSQWDVNMSLISLNMCCFNVMLKK